MRETIRSAYLRKGSSGVSREGGVSVILSAEDAGKALDSAVVVAGGRSDADAVAGAAPPPCAATLVGARAANPELLLSLLLAQLPPVEGGCGTARLADITCLDLNKCELGDAGLSRLASAIPMQSPDSPSVVRTLSETVTRIDLSWNCLTDASVSDAISLFTAFPKLQHISLAQNYFTLSQRRNAAVTPGVKGASLKMLHAFASRTPRVLSLDFGAESLRDPSLKGLAEMLHGRYLEANAERLQAISSELSQAMEAHRKLTGDQRREQDEVAAREARERREIESYEAERTREMVRRKNKFLQNERRRLKSKDEIRRQRNREECAELEEDETSRRAGVRREEEVERRQLSFAESNSKERLAATLQFRKRQLQLLDLQREFADKVRGTESKHRADLVRQFIKAMQQCMVRERRGVFTKEVDNRERIVKRQEEERKAILRARRAVSAWGWRGQSKRKDGVGVKEIAQRSLVVGEEQRIWRELCEAERVGRKAAKEQTYAADLSPDGGILRVVLRKEAFVRLDIDDQQEALREQCNIDFLLAAPDATSEGTEELIVKLKEQQGEAFNARARERSMLLVEDWSVLNFESLEDGALGATSAQALANSFSRSSFTVIPKG